MKEIPLLNIVAGLEFDYIEVEGKDLTPKELANALSELIDEIRGEAYEEGKEEAEEEEYESGYLRGYEDAKAELGGE